MFPDESGKRYRTFDSRMKEIFGRKVVKIPLDGGFTCPNRDGRKGYGGCVFCGDGGGEARAIRDSGSAIRNRPAESPDGAAGAEPIPSYERPRAVPPLREQYERGREALRGKWGDAPAIAYFQSYTSTYAPITRLRALYEEALSLPDVVGLTVATRPDALPDDVLDLLEELSRRTFLTVELGLQSIRDETSARLNRGCTYAEFLAGYRSLKARGIAVCVHLIDGLPGETREMMLDTVRAVAALAPDFVKFHELYIRRGTALEAAYLRGEVRLLTRGEYVSVLAAQIALLPPGTVVERVTGDPLREELVAPDWAGDKKKIRAQLDKTLAAEQITQGIYANCTKMNI